MQQLILDAAVAASLAAGIILRHDFHAPFDHAATKAAEMAAERLIRDRLLATCPDWGFRGEETDVHFPVERGLPWWVVDPLDGTNDHEVGIRSGAVSIAVVHEGVPVLGVVYAYAAPDDEGDLFAWAEGCGPLHRNGSPVERAPLSRTLGTSDVILVSSGADAKPKVNVKTIAPARFRAIPGIALRLALVAAGDASAGVSLNGPCDWDVAGGHALLRAVGGDLINQDGEPVRYDSKAQASTRNCFGAHPDLGVLLSRADWGSILRASPEVVDRCRPARGETIRDAALLSRAQGCLLGQVAGDNLGGLVEFSSAQSIRQGHPDGVRRLADGGVWGILAGQPTDDSELALSLARSMVHAGGYDADAAAAAYGAWYRSHPFDKGSTTSQALCAVSEPAPDRRTGSAEATLQGGRTAAVGGPAHQASHAANPQSQANGSLMRISPLGVFGYEQPVEALVAMAREDSGLTHPHLACRDACAAYTVAVAHAIRTGDPAAAVYDAALRWAEAHACSEVTSWLRDAATAAPSDASHHQGWVRHALQNAFHQLLHAPTLEEGVVNTVMLGGDTDTNAAIAGALLGAVHGRDAIPSQWRHMVLSCHSVSGTGRPRPSTYWPVDVLVLAERLLALGARVPSAVGLP